MHSAATAGALNRKKCLEYDHPVAPDLDIVFGRNLSRFDQYFAGIEFVEPKAEIGRQGVAHLALKTIEINGGLYMI